jgi:hypothetical protein
LHVILLRQTILVGGCDELNELLHYVEQSLWDCTAVHYNVVVYNSRGLFYRKSPVKKKVNGEVLVNNLVHGNEGIPSPEKEEDKSPKKEERESSPLLDFSKGEDKPIRKTGMERGS